MPVNHISRYHLIAQSLISVSLYLSLLNTAQAKSSKPALGIGLESSLAHHVPEDQIRPSIGLRASFSFLETVRRELGKGIPTNWKGVYGRLQNDFDGHPRTAVGITAGYYLLHGELGWSTYEGKQSVLFGPELLIGLGVFDLVGLYTRWTWLSNDHSIFELGLRVNYPLWVGKTPVKKSRRKTRRRIQKPNNTSYSRVNKPRKKRRPKRD